MERSGGALWALSKCRYVSVKSKNIDKQSLLTLEDITYQKKGDKNRRYEWTIKIQII